MPLEFWFDFASTYSYIAAMRIEALCGAKGVPLTWRPMQLGPIFALQGWKTSPFVLNPQRGAYMWRDMERLTAKFGLPWQRPSSFPRVATLAARVAAAYDGAPWLGDFVRASFAAAFGSDADLNDRSLVRSLLASLDLDAADVLDAASTPPRSTRLRANTERAIALGVFGAPTCTVDGELFWGEEALDDAIAWAETRSERSLSN